MHLTLEERQSIEQALNCQTSLRMISKQLGRPLSTISREVKKHAKPNSAMPYGRIKNRCIHRKECDKVNVCNTSCYRKCSRCNTCNKICPDFVEEVCPTLQKAPFVCNGCSSFSTCILSKKTYRASDANKAYRDLLVQSRSGFNLTEQELQTINDLYSPLIRQGQSIYHISATHPDDIIRSQRTIYRLLHMNVLDARNIDMPRVCRLKPRLGTPRHLKIDKQCRIGRTIKDFEQFRSEHPDYAIVQIDSVIGRIGGKVLLTILLTSCDFMIAFLRDANTSASVISSFDWLRQRLGDRFPSMFAILLGDNGSEFSNPREIERSDVHMFYCDPSSPSQKPLVELNHEFLRRILPGGSSFDHLIQHDINLMLSHINSYSRNKFGGKSPADVITSIYGEDVLHLLCQQRIPPEKIVLKPSLLRR